MDENDKDTKTTKPKKKIVKTKKADKISIPDAEQKKFEELHNECKRAERKGRSKFWDEIAKEQSEECKPKKNAKVKRAMFMDEIAKAEAECKPEKASKPKKKASKPKNANPEVDYATPPDSQANPTDSSETQADHPETPPIDLPAESSPTPEDIEKEQALADFTFWNCIMDKNGNWIPLMPLDIDIDPTQELTIDLITSSIDDATIQDLIVELSNKISEILEEANRRYAADQPAEDDSSLEQNDDSSLEQNEQNEKVDQSSDENPFENPIIPKL